MKGSLYGVAVAVGVLASAAPVEAQTFPTNDPVIQRIWAEGTQNSQIYPLAQALVDSIGPRLNNTPEHRAGNDWLVQKYREWGITARNEQYGTWPSWRRGISHLDLVEPRVRSLEAMILAWTPGTQGPVNGGVVVLPEVGSAADFEAWLPQVRGNFVAISFPEPTCRPDANWREFALPESFTRMQQERTAARQAWAQRITNTGHSNRDLQRRLEQAGAIGVLTSNWPNAWGVTRIFNGFTQQVPTWDLSCEDYGLVVRLAQHGQSPRLRANADAEFLGEIPVFNTIAEIRGRQLPNEYVMLSAHFDSWDGSSGATDNGTGTIVMMEAMRILRQVYPNPRRTILVGHWGGEEQGLNGSRAFVADNPRIVQNLQALFNQDNGTGRVVNISMSGFSRAGTHFGRWLGQIPSEITRHIRLDMPGMPGAGGTDHASFICAGAPGFNLSALNWEYSPYTWHTNRDTFDKIVWDDLRNNALLTAMLAYLASEDRERVSRERRQLPVNPNTGQQLQWPACQPPARSAAESPRM